MSKRKKVKDRRDSKIEKIPRSDKSIIDYQNEPASWHIGFLDLEGIWGWNKVDHKNLVEVILPQLKNFESMKWGEILNRNNHEINTSSIIKDAQKRLVELNLDDYENLISLRLRSRNRVWGIRHNNILRILWWDPDHEICPSILKHT